MTGLSARLVGTSKNSRTFQLELDGKPLKPCMETPQIEFDEKSGLLTVFSGGVPDVFIPRPRE